MAEGKFKKVTDAVASPNLVVCVGIAAKKKSPSSSSILPV